MSTVLRYGLLFFLLLGCKEKSTLGPDQEAETFSKPASVIANPPKGYAINPVSGDSVRVVLNAAGDTIQSGISFPVSGPIVTLSKMPAPEVKKLGNGSRIDVAGNIQPLTGELQVHTPDLLQLQKVVVGQGDSSIQLINSGGQIKTGVQIPFEKKPISFLQPKPVKAFRLRYKDKASVNIQYLDVEQGMSSSYVLSVLEDRRGNLWFGTDGAGVSRYDGVTFTHFTEKQGLTDNIVNCIYEDINGMLWFGTVNGVTRYDGNSFMQITEKDGLGNNLITDITGDKKGNIWFATDGAGVSRFDGASLVNYTSKEGLINDHVKCITEDRTGKLWIGTDSGVSRFDGNSFTQFTTREGLAGNKIRSILETKSGKLWFGTSGNGIISFDGKQFVNHTKENGLLSNYTAYLKEDNNGNIFISTYEGIDKFDGKHFTHYTIKEGITNKTIRRSIVDRNGNIWWGTDGGGVNKLNDRSFVHLIDYEKISSYKVRGIIKDRDGNFWFGSNGGGLTKFDGKTFINYSRKDGLATDGVRCIVEDRKGVLWFGLDGFGICKLERGYLTNYNVSQGLPSNIIRALLEDGKGNLWVGTFGGGAAKFDGISWTWFTEKEGLSSNNVIALMEDRNGNIWIGTDGGGAAKYDGARIIQYTEKEGLPSNKIFSLLEDSKGNIWMGSSGGGVCRYDGKNFTYFTDADGLSNNNVWSILEDYKGQLWFGTDNGLTLFIPRTDSTRDSYHQYGYSIFRFGLQDGLKAGDFNLKSAYTDSTNMIWWGTGKSLMYLDATKMPQSEYTPLLQLSYLEINDEIYDFLHLPDSINDEISIRGVPEFSNYPTGLHLPHELNHLTFHFAAMDWAAPHMVRYSYRLAGFDNKWSSPNETALAEYRNLDYGEYQLQVKAIGQSQRWSSPVTFSFEILPAWWQTWWFRTLLFIMMAAVVYLVTRYVYSNKLRRQRILMEKELAVQYERQRISSDMHDDIGAGLSGVRLMTEMAKNKLTDKDARNEVDRIYQSVNAITGRMKEVIWSLNVENDNLASLVTFIQKQARQLMENYPGDFEIEMPDNIPDVDIPGESRRDIYLSVKEGLHNVIKHASASKVKLSIFYNRNLVINIEDNGRGFSYPENKHSGNGLRNMKLRMEKIGGDFRVQVDGGTKLIFEIPLKAVI